MFSNVKYKLGFGGMRFPMRDGKVDHTALTEMIDTFMGQGFNYFDTARGYHNGMSETALRECLVKRYPRESFVLCNKLSTQCFTREDEIRPLFASQLEACGVDCFDFYLLHAQDKKLFEKYKSCHAYEAAFAFKKEGKVKHVGISFHDRASVLEHILTEYPEIEVVQIQFNYMDYDDPAIESRACYEICQKYGKPVIVMEPVKGGTLVQLPDGAKSVLKTLGGGSIASYAIRFAASFEGVNVVLSGMSDMDMLLDNMGYMKAFKPLDVTETRALEQVCSILREQKKIPCTACRYCTDSCPKNIAIPELFSCLNGKTAFETWNYSYYYRIHTQKNGRASDCISCGKCEALCPQHLPIREHLKAVAEEFES